MDFKDKKIREISTVIETLSLKLAMLQAKVDDLCKSTGACPQVKKVHKHLLPAEEPTEEQEI